MQNIFNKVVTFALLDSNGWAGHTVVDKWISNVDVSNMIKCCSRVRAQVWESCRKWNITTAKISFWWKGSVRWAEVTWSEGDRKKSWCGYTMQAHIHKNNMVQHNICQHDGPGWTEKKKTQESNTFKTNQGFGDWARLFGWVVKFSAVSGDKSLCQENRNLCSVLTKTVVPEHNKLNFYLPVYISCVCIGLIKPSGPQFHQRALLAYSSFTPL